MSKDKEIVYEPHPVSVERKVELRAAGVQIVDARFAPVDLLREDGPTIAEYIAAGYKATTYPPKGYVSRSTPDEITEAIAAQAGSQGEKPMTIPQIKEALAAKGVEIPEGVTKRDDLKALLDAPDANQGS